MDRMERSEAERKLLERQQARAAARAQAALLQARQAVSETSKTHIQRWTMHLNSSRLITKKTSKVTKVLTIIGDPLKAETKAHSGDSEHKFQRHKQHHCLHATPSFQHEHHHNNYHGQSQHAKSSYQLSCQFSFHCHQAARAAAQAARARAALAAAKAAARKRRGFVLSSAKKVSTNPPHVLGRKRDTHHEQWALRILNSSTQGPKKDYNNNFKK